MAKAKEKRRKRRAKVDRKTKAVRKLGTFEGQVVISDDFDAPLPEEVLAAFEGKDEPKKKKK